MAVPKFLRIRKNCRNYIGFPYKCHPGDALCIILKKGDVAKELKFLELEDGEERWKHKNIVKQ